jgi:hypothetical protein
MMRVPRRKARADERISAGMIRHIFRAGRENVINPP